MWNIDFLAQGENNPFNSFSPPGLSFSPLTQNYL